VEGKKLGRRPRKIRDVEKRRQLVGGRTRQDDGLHDVRVRIREVVVNRMPIDYRPHAIKENREDLE
jgi:hypothetical protein